MKSFQYTIKDELGIHARPAGLIVNEAKKHTSTITIKAGEKSANATRLMAIMAMGIKSTQDVTITAEGKDEEKAIEAMKQIFEANL